MKLQKEAIEAIEKSITRVERVELIPGKDGVKIVRVRREELKTK